MRGRSGGGNLRIWAPGAECMTSSTLPATITCAWGEKGELGKKAVFLVGPGPYEVIAEDHPVDEHVELFVPKDVRR